MASYATLFLQGQGDNAGLQHGSAGLSLEAVTMPPLSQADDWHLLPLQTNLLQSTGVA
jgi:hypothetical protein